MAALSIVIITIAASSSSSPAASDNHSKPESTGDDPIDASEEPKPPREANEGDSNDGEPLGRWGGREDQIHNQEGPTHRHGREQKTRYDPYEEST